MPKSMDRFYEVLHKTVTGFLIPLVFYLLGQINEVKKEVSIFELRVAKDSAQYAMRDDIVRVETKIDELKTLIIQEVKRNEHYYTGFKKAD